MKQKLFSITMLFSICMILVTSILYTTERPLDTQDTSAEQILAINELVQLAKAGELEHMINKSAQLQTALRMTKVQEHTAHERFLMCGVAIVFFVTVFGYVYAAILRPFDKMKRFAQDIAQGNFDVPLDYERSNYFGAFTWAFDSMRREITKARACEHEAIENNKTVIATLSHDIKTPIASIRAYAEALEANLDTTAEKREKYLSVLMKKCDEVSRLTDDLFLHSLADLDKLKISVEKVEICSFMELAAAELATERNDIRFHKPAFTAEVSADRNRLMQITENLINNARKYAKSQIDVFLTQEIGTISIHFRDYGTGIPSEDLPFIFHQFYRGKNSNSEPGSGLGLYIVKYIVGQMHGEILLHNHADGLEAVVNLPLLAFQQTKNIP